MNQAIEAYLTRAARKLSPATIEAYGRDLRRFAEYLKERNIAASPGEVSQTAMLSYAMWLQETQAAATAARALSAVRTFYDDLARRRLVEQDPTEGVSGYAAAPARPHKPAPELAEPDNPRDRALLALLAVGVKPGELAAMAVGDVSLAGGYVRARSAKRDVTLPLGGAKPAVAAHMAGKGADAPLFGLTRQGIWKIVKGYELRANN